MEKNRKPIGTTGRNWNSSLFSLPKVGPSSFGRLDVSFPSKTSEGFQGAKSVDG